MHLTVTPKCPDCQSRAGVLRIEYGPSAQTGPGRFVVADRLVTVDSPRWGSANHSSRRVIQCSMRGL